MSKYDIYRQQILETALSLTKKGFLMATGGNLSVRIPGEQALAITPSNYDYLKMNTDDVCILDFDLHVIEGKRKPSVESALHIGIYKTRDDVKAIVHTHQVYASALAIMRTPIPALFDEQARFLGRRVEIIPYAPSGTAMLKNVIARHVKSCNNAYIMQNHGALCFGHDIERAAHNVEILEKCSLAYLLALCTERKISRIPLAVREIAFAKLRKDQKRVQNGDFDLGGE
jgi:L-ribulose-5-phosphate 4-epimerase